MDFGWEIAHAAVSRGQNKTLFDAMYEVCDADARMLLCALLWTMLPVGLQPATTGVQLMVMIPFLAYTRTVRTTSQVTECAALFV
jgi:hypothetical protein